MLFSALPEFVLIAPLVLVLFALAPCLVPCVAPVPIAGAVLAGLMRENRRGWVLPDSRLVLCGGAAWPLTDMRQFTLGPGFLCIDRVKNRHMPLLGVPRMPDAARRINATILPLRL